MHMNKIQFLSLACLSVAGLALAGAAHAQSTGNCPTLAADSGLTWKQLDGPGFTFCKALRDADGSEAFAVTISEDSPFKPRRGDRAEQASIDGQNVYWYRSEVAAAPNVLVRETLLELEQDRVAHISMHAGSQEQLAELLRQVDAIRFQEKRLSSN
jgi:hypothetical protein